MSAAFRSAADSSRARGIGSAPRPRLCLRRDATVVEVADLAGAVRVAEFAQQTLGVFCGGPLRIEIDDADEHLGPLEGDTLEEAGHRPVPGRERLRQRRLIEAER